MGIEKLTGSRAFNDIKKLLSSKKTFNYPEFLRLINDAGYQTGVNGKGHIGICRKKDGTLIRYKSGLPVILSNNRRDLPPGKYKGILKLIRDDIEKYS